MRIRLSPYKNPRNWRHRTVGVSVVAAGGKSRPTATPSTTPAERQMYRELKPVFAHLLKGFLVRVRMITPKPVHSGAVRGAGRSAREINLFSISDENLDSGGNPFIENEEAMLSILQLDLFSDAVLRHTAGFCVNLKSPVLRKHGHGLYHPHGFHIHPTTYMEKKYFSE
jgi:hypothetical protein